MSQATVAPTTQDVAVRMLDELLAPIDLRDDPALRHGQLARFGDVLAEMQREVARRKAACAAELADRGLRHHEVAEALGLRSRQRAQQLVKEGRTRPPR